MHKELHIKTLERENVMLRSVMKNMQVTHIEKCRCIADESADRWSPFSAMHNCTEHDWTP